jgi:hypothetical protein
MPTAERPQGECRCPSRIDLRRSPNDVKGYQCPLRRHGGGRCFVMRGPLEGLPGSWNVHVDGEKQTRPRCH